MTRTVSVLAAAALACALVPGSAQSQKIERRTAAVVPVSLPVPEVKSSAPLVTAVTLADLGFSAGLRFSNLGGRREIFVPLPQGAELAANELVLSLDDVSAHEAKRSLEILVNDRSAAAVALDGRSTGRQIRIPLARAKGRAGFFKLGFVYSGAATQDRCIDVRYIGDSLTIRPESAVEIDIGSRTLDVATTAALMPHDVAVVLSSRSLGSADLAAALTIGRSLKASGRRVTFFHGFETLMELARRDDARRWSRGLILVGSLQEVSPFIETQPARVAGSGGTPLGTLAAVTAGGLPAILVSDTDVVRAGRLLASTLLPAVRGVPVATPSSQSSPRARSRESTLRSG